MLIKEVVENELSSCVVSAELPLMHSEQHRGRFSVLLKFSHNIETYPCQSTDLSY